MSIRDEYIDARDIDEEDILSDEPAPVDEWEDMPTTPRWRDANIGENQLD